MALRVAWIGSHMEGVDALISILSSETAHVEGVIQLDGMARSRRSGAVDYKPLIADYHVPVYEVSDINSPESASILESLKPDIAFVIGWSQILSPQLLKIPRIGTVGAHASLLPNNRGSAPVNWSLIKGEVKTGNTLIWLSSAVDGGDIIDQTPLDISIYDTCATVYGKVAQSNRTMIARLVGDLNGGRCPRHPNPDIGEPLLPRRRPADGLIQWGTGSRCVYNFVRALTRPYPGAFSWLDGRRWTIWKCALLPDVFPDGPPGKVLGPLVSPEPAACGQIVSCGEGAVCVLEVEAGDRVLRGPELSEAPWKGKSWSND